MAKKKLNPDLLAWLRSDRLVKAWITATISEEALGTVVGITTSNDVWNALANAYSQNLQAREFELLFKLQEKKKDSTPLYVYLTEFKSTCDQLNAIEKPVPDPNKVFWLLNGLRPRYESFSTAMLKPPVPSYVDLIPLLQSHDLRQKSHVFEPANPTLAFVSQQSTQRFSPKHTSPQPFTSRGRGFSQSNSRPSYNHRQYHNSISQKPHSNQSRPPSICQVCKRRGHEALKCWHRFDNSYQDEDTPQALAAIHLNEPEVGE
ncbi:hypothetical protein GIB67_030735 [Kingdonia uniflora]|uniref:Gag protein n=1 Tax=Kingdonia uniflora TaxID=39325 RepID=A0A7J7L2V9_9MAGN|nr:hypothetical protein GIB67_030735 [Kingdonia uniflora]